MFVVPESPDQSMLPTVFDYDSLVEDVVDACCRDHLSQYVDLAEEWEERWPFVAYCFLCLDGTETLRPQPELRQVLLLYSGRLFRLIERDISCSAKPAILPKVPREYAHLIPRSRACS